MICPNCGAENNASYQFCQRCGTRLAGQTPVNQPQQNAYQPQQGGYQPQQGGYQPQQGGYQPQQNAYQPYQGGYQPQQKAPANKPGKKLQLPGKFKNIDLKKLLPKEPKKLIIPGVVGAVVLVAVIVLICVLSAGGGSGFGGREINYYTFYNPTEDEEMALYANGELVEEGLEFEDDIRLTSLDGEVLCMLTYEGEAYVARDGELSLLADEIEMVAMSVDGSTVACVNEDQELVLFDTKKLEETFVAEEAYFPVLSPDGKSVAYTCADEEGEEIMLFYFDGKKSVELGKDMVAISVSNGGKYIYAYNGEKDAVYTMDSKGESAKLCAGLDDGVTVLLNADHTQIILRADGKWYASEKGGEKIKLSSKVTNFGIVEPIHGDSSAQESFLNVRTMALEDLSGHFYMGDNTLYYLTGKWECEKVESDLDGDYVTVTLDGKTAFYMEDGENLFKVTAKKLDEPVEVAEEIEDYVITPDGSAVYFLDEDSTLFYQKGNKDPKRIGDDVDNLYMTHDGYCLFMTDYSNYAGDVYASHNGSKKELVQSDVYRVYTLSNVTYLALDYDKDEYAFSMDYATKGIKFQFMFEP